MGVGVVRYTKTMPGVPPFAVFFRRVLSTFLGGMGDGPALFSTGALVVGILYVLVQRFAGADGRLSTRTRELINAATTYACGALVWPVIWFCLVSRVMIQTAPLTLLGFAWPIVIILLDLLWVTKQPLEPDDTKKTSFTFDGNAISSLSFALGGILLSQVGKTFAASASPMLSACIFLVVAFVLPSPGVHARTGIGAIILAAKKIAMAFCVGLLISSIAISLQVGIERRRTSVTHDALDRDEPSADANVKGL